MFKKRKKREFKNDTLKSLNKTINGYEGYEKLGKRKQTDKAIRTYLHNQVLIITSKFSKVQNLLMKGQMLNTWGYNNKIQNTLNKIRDLLANDTYGHSTFFITENIFDMLEITVFYTLENECILILNQVENLIEDISDRIENLNLVDIDNDVIRIYNYLNSVYKALSDRSELIRAFELV